MAGDSRAPARERTGKLPVRDRYRFTTAEEVKALVRRLVPDLARMANNLTPLIEKAEVSRARGFITAWTHHHKRGKFPDGDYCLARIRDWIDAHNAYLARRTGLFDSRRD